MTGPSSSSRRVFLGQAAVGGLTAGVAGAVLAGCLGGGAQPRRWSVATENSLPGDRHWQITTLGAPDAIMGYASRASVLPGEPIDLYVSTTAREFVVRAYRLGWYN